MANCGVLASTKPPCANFGISGMLNSPTKPNGLTPSISISCIFLRALFKPLNGKEIILLIPPIRALITAFKPLSIPSLIPSKTLPPELNTSLTAFHALLNVFLNQSDTLPKQPLILVHIPPKKSPTFEKAAFVLFQAASNFSLKKAPIGDMIFFIAPITPENICLIPSHALLQFPVNTPVRKVITPLNTSNKLPNTSNITPNTSPNVLATLLIIFAILGPNVLIIHATKGANV